MNKKNVKTNLLDHSEAKVKLLSEYLKRYLNIIVNDKYTKRIQIFDLFCGEGLYENGGEGSPLVIMRIVKEVYYSNIHRLKKLPPMDCLFNDIDKVKTNKVEEVIKLKNLYSSEFGAIQFKNHDYAEFVNSLSIYLSKLKKEKVFVFIDPYGYKHIKASDIKSLLSSKKVELLLFLPTQFMYRFNASGSPEALIDFIEELIDYKSWNELKVDCAWKYIDQLKVAFRDYLGQEYFVDTFTIQKDPQTVFCLFFFCSHIRGFEKMLEAKWEIDTEQGKGWDYSGNQESLFFDQKTNLLEKKLKELLHNNSNTNGEIYEFTLRCGFLPKHTNEVFENLQNNGKLRVEAIGNVKIRKGSFYIGYQYFKDEPEKVKIGLV